MYFFPLPFRIWHYEDFDVENENKGKQNKRSLSKVPHSLSIENLNIEYSKFDTIKFKGNYNK